MEEFETYYRYVIIVVSSCFKTKQFKEAFEKINDALKTRINTVTKIEEDTDEENEEENELDSQSENECVDIESEVDDEEEDTSV